MVKVARSATLVVLLALFSPVLSAQNITSINLSCKKTALLEVIASLSKTTGLDFIYSSDKINSNQSISLDVENESIDNILKRLSLLVGLDFRRQGQYVVIKSALPDRHESPRQHVEYISKKAPDIVPMMVPDSLLIEQYAKLADERIIATNVTAHSTAPLEKFMIDFKPYVDTALLKKIPVQYLRRMSIKSRSVGWFTSVGLMANDFSAGTEMQVGMRSVHAVVNLARLRNAKFRFGYGLGIAIPLYEKFSLNPVYTHATNSAAKTETYRNVRGRQKTHEVRSSAKQDQLKLMIQYAFSSTPITARVGLTLNQEQTKYYYTELEADKPKHPTPPSLPIPPPSTHSAVAYPHVEQESQFPAHSTARWLSWEAGVSYRISFTRHK